MGLDARTATRSGEAYLKRQARGKAFRAEGTGRRIGLCRYAAGGAGVCVCVCVCVRVRVSVRVRVRVRVRVHARARARTCVSVCVCAWVALCTRCVERAQDVHHALRAVGRRVLHGDMTVP